jgi:DNA-directed RNA polymerase subunit K/omega
MNQHKYSRGSTVDIEKCVENMGNNRFMLIVVGAAKVREIAYKNKHSERYEHRHPVVTVLKEIENGQLDITGIKYIR